MGEVKYSFIIVSLNSEETIGKTIDSIIQQNRSDYEVIFIDGCSRDHTVDIIKDKTEEISDRVVIISEKDDGLYYAMNKGLMKSRAPWVSFLNSDDWLEGDALFQIDKAIIVDPDAEIFYGLINIVDKIKIMTVATCWENLPNANIPHPGTFTARSLFERIGNFDTKYRLCADYDFFLRAYFEKAKFYQIDSVLANYQVGGLSTKRARLGEREKITIQAKYRENSWIKRSLRLMRASVRRFL
jgi:glycosyltransferase involved in cell wall biosynthesis